MPRVFEALSQTEAGYVRGLLRAAGIGAEVRGDALFPLVGVGNQAPGVLPSVWVDDREAARARELVAQYQQGPSLEGACGWTCPDCAEAHAPQFTSCWKCGAERQD